MVLTDDLKHWQSFISIFVQPRHYLKRFSVSVSMIIGGAGAVGCRSGGVQERWGAGAVGWQERWGAASGSPFSTIAYCFRPSLTVLDTLLSGFLVILIFKRKV